MTNAMPSPGVLGSLFGLAFLSTFVAYIIYYRIVATAGSVNLMLVTFLVPVSAIILGTSLLGEPTGVQSRRRHGCHRPGVGGARRPTDGDVEAQAHTQPSLRRLAAGRTTAPTWSRTTLS